MLYSEGEVILLKFGLFVSLRPLSMDLAFLWIEYLLKLLPYPSKKNMQFTLHNGQLSAPE